ncbi:hypothetical protein NKH77_47240 [Streptomyces sp. M19]
MLGVIAEEARRHGYLVLRTGCATSSSDQPFHVLAQLFNSGPDAGFAPARRPGCCATWPTRPRRRRSASRHAPRGLPLSVAAPGAGPPPTPGRYGPGGAHRRPPVGRPRHAGVREPHAQLARGRPDAAGGRPTPAADLSQVHRALARAVEQGTARRIELGPLSSPRARSSPACHGTAPPCADCTGPATATRCTSRRWPRPRRSR